MRSWKEIAIYKTCQRKEDSNKKNEDQIWQKIKL
jgi:hypothetical protein